MDDVRKLKEIQLDALREVANIGAGHAATALSQLTNRRVMISVPQITISQLDEIPNLFDGSEKLVVAVVMHMLGDLTGRTLLMLEQTNAHLLCDLLLNREPGTTRTLEALEESTMKEAGNILGGAYLNALSDFMGMMLLPSVPSLMTDVPSNVLTGATLNLSQDRDVVLCVETDFHYQEVDQRLLGHFLLLPDVAAIQAIFNAIRVH